MAEAGVFLCASFQGSALERTELVALPRVVLAVSGSSERSGVTLNIRSRLPPAPLFAKILIANLYWRSRTLVRISFSARSQSIRTAGSLRPSFTAISAFEIPRKFRITITLR